MILFDRMMISGLRWVLGTIGNAASSEADDGPALREALLEAGLRLERGEISAEEFARIEDALLSRLREARHRSAPPGGPIALAGAAPGEPPQVEACIVGEFHQVPARPARGAPPRRAPGRRRARKP